MAFESNGMLAPGIHDVNIEDFKKDFVEGFTTSQSRSTIFISLTGFFQEIIATGLPYEIWIDGSFVTSKVNPNDVDLVIFLNLSQYAILSPHLDSIRMKYSGKLDVYFDVAASDENQAILSPQDFGQITNKRNYWKGQFGFDRSDNPKGIVRLSRDSINQYVKGGIR